MKRSLALALLLVLGLGRMLADVLGLESIAAAAAATGASPAPKVFSSVDSLETYSSKFFLERTLLTGSRERIEITPELYQRLRGPYNRRNAYGAVLAYGPVLAARPHTAELFRTVSRFALCGEAPLLQELGIDGHAARSDAPIRIYIVPRDGTRTELPLVLEVTCA